MAAVAASDEGRPNDREGREPEHGWIRRFGITSRVGANPAHLVAPLLCGCDVSTH